MAKEILSNKIAINQNDILHYLKPAYYNQFSCIGKDCQHTCCKDWNITMTKKEYFRIRNTALSKKLEQNGKRIYQRIKKDGSDILYAKMNINLGECCQFQNQEGLCELQLNYGHEMLSTTCQKFPRRHILIGKTLILEMTLGCEAIFDLLKTYPEGVPLLEEKDRPEVHHVVGLPATDGAENRVIYDYYAEIYLLSLSILQYKELPFEEKILYLGMVMKELDRMEGEGLEQEIPQYIRKVMKEISSGVGHMLSEVKRQPELQVISAVGMMSVLFESDAIMVSKLKMIFSNLGLVRKDVEGENITASLTFSTTLDRATFEKAVWRMEHLFQGREYILSNIAVNWFSNLSIPFQLSERSIWENYLLFAGLIHILKYMIMGCIQEGKEEQSLTEIVTLCSRSLNHNQQRLKDLLEHLLRENTNTLAHVAILIK